MVNKSVHGAIQIALRRVYLKAALRPARVGGGVSQECSAQLPRWHVRALKGRRDSWARIFLGAGHTGCCSLVP